MTSDLATPSIPPSAPAFVARPRRGPQLGRQQLIWLGVLAMLLLHIPLALVMKRVHGLSTLHALGSLGVGLIWALSDRPRRVAFVAAYMASSEILWRMTGASVFWEFGKYGIALLFLVSMAKSERLRPQLAPVLYFLLLLPAVIPTLFKYEWADSRRDISFNLSGPFAMMMATLFFHRLKMSRADVVRLFASLIAPLLGVAGIAGSAVLSSTIAFGHGSNELASGGFGPNQVSSAMGLGILVAFLGLMDRSAARQLKLLFFAIILVFAMQSALTLSRSGLAIAFICIGCASLFLVRNGRTRIQMAAAGALLFALFHFVIFPRLDAFTGGAISARFSNTNPTGRDTIMLVDMKIWANYPVLGCGVGEAQMEREKYYRLIAAHNEFTRLVAEHGLLGFTAGLLLIIIAVKSFRRARGSYAQALVASMICFSFLFMLANGMRLALVPFTFGMAAANFLPLLARKNIPVPALAPSPERATRGGVTSLSRRRPARSTG